MNQKVAWSKEDVRELEDGSLEIMGQPVDNPLMGLTFRDPNTPEFKAELWSKIYREGLHVTRNSTRIRAVLLNMMNMSVASIKEALEVDYDE